MRRVQGPALCVAWICLVALPVPGQIVTQPGEMPAPSDAASPQRDLDESTFRDGLRRRGLDDWLEQHLADTPPLGPIDEQLRLREKLLAEAQAFEAPQRLRQNLVAQASELLSKLLADHPDHPARLTWRLELARDKLEREDPAAFEAVLLYELPGLDRARAAKLSGEAVTILQTLREEVAHAWKAFESLDERSMARAAESGATRPLEQIDGQSAFLLTWARFCHTISADLPESDRNAKLTELLATITERYGWTAPAPGREVLRCGALAMSAVGLRLTGRFAESDRAAREIIETFANIRSLTARHELRRTILLAVLEQIRGPRDTGKFDDAQAILEEARTWAGRTQPGDMRTELALALAERNLMARRTAALAPATDSASPPDLLTPAEALLPLQRVAAISPAARDALYHALAGAIGRGPLARQSPFALQLAAGAAVAEASTGLATQPAGQSRGTEIAVALNAALIHPPAPLTDETRGELLFLLARAQYLSGAPLEAARILCDLVEQLPRHDRAEHAAQQATAIAQDALRSHTGPDAAGARMAFVRAARLLRNRSPESPAARRLQFFIAAALDENGRLEEAAEEYAAVPAGDPHALRAARAAARCLRDAYSAAAATRPADDSVKDLLQRALQAARSAAAQAANASPEEACLSAEITLMLAGLLDHPAVAQHEEVIRVLQDFETRHAGCPAAVASALRERVSALRQLKRMGEARAAVEQFLAADPENAGPLMARLLDAMRDEISAAQDRGHSDAAKATAEEAASLAARLLEWAKAHPGRLSPAEMLTVSIWQARATLEAGHAREALTVYDRAGKAPPDLLPADSAPAVEIRLGRAECLLALEKPAEALPVFNELLSAVPEQSPNWWRAYVGTLECHTRLKQAPEQIVQSIRQQRRLFPDLGGPRWARELQRIEEANSTPSSK